MSKTLHFKITLRDSEPEIWRTFTVNDSYRMDRFHQVIQLVMGWRNAHLHEFVVNDRKIGMLIDNGFDLPDVEDENRIYLRDLDLQEGSTMEYLYDFGDFWAHHILLEKVEADTGAYPSCTGGEKACPPEDCGGIWRYKEVLKILQDPTHKEYDEMKEWYGDLKPDAFPLAAINRELEKFGKWHRKYPRKKSTPWHRV